MSLQGILACGGTGILVLLTLIQIAPVRINPWSAIAKALGKAVNADIVKELTGIKEKLDQHVAMDDRRMAEMHRVQILRFNNELLRGIGHTKEEFIETLGDIDAYEGYCREHPDYPNNRAVLAVDNIRSSYKRRLQERDFLSENAVEAQAPSTDDRF